MVRRGTLWPEGRRRGVRKKGRESQARLRHLPGDVYGKAKTCLRAAAKHWGRRLAVGLTVTGREALPMGATHTHAGTGDDTPGQQKGKKATFPENE